MTCKMSGFVETLGASKVYPLTNSEEQNKKEQRKINKDMGENSESKGAKEQGPDDIQLIKSKIASDLGLILCPSPQPYKDKGGRSRPKRKHRVLERLNTSSDLGGRREAEVQIESLSIVCPGRPKIALSHPFISSPKACLFTLKEGTKYKLKFLFVVSNNVVSGLRYEHTLWKAGIRVGRSIVNLGTFSPQQKPHGIELEEETLPSGILIRGLYAARAKVVDENEKCYMDIHYHFDIQKNWPLSS